MEHMRQCTPAELEQIMNQYGTMVYRLAYAQVRNSADADDIYQEVFLKYYRKCPAFQSEEHRKAWLLRVTINRTKSHLSSAWRRYMVPLETEGVVFCDPQVMELDAALGMLKPDERKLLHLFYYEGNGIREIAQLLHRKESTVRTQLTRARKHLKKVMKGEAYEQGSLSENE